MAYFLNLFLCYRLFLQYLLSHFKKKFADKNQMINIHNCITFESYFENWWKTTKSIWTFDELMKKSPWQIWGVTSIYPYSKHGGSNINVASFQIIKNTTTQWCHIVTKIWTSPKTYQTYTNTCKYAIHSKNYFSDYFFLLLWHHVRHIYDHVRHVTSMIKKTTILWNHIVTKIWILKIYVF